MNKNKIDFDLTFLSILQILFQIHDLKRQNYYFSYEFQDLLNGN